MIITFIFLIINLNSLNYFNFLNVKMKASQVKNKKSILFLHGFGYNSDQFKQSHDSVLKTFENEFPQYQILIPDAPHILNSLEVK